MSQDILKQAENKLDLLDRRIEGFQKQLQQAVRERDDLKTFVTKYHELSNMLAPTERKRDGTSTDETVEFIRAKAIALGRPIPLNEGYKLAVEAGLNIGGVNPINTFGARLSNAGKRGDRIISLRNFGWWAADKPFALADYHPPKPSTPESDDQYEREWIGEHVSLEEDE